MALPSPGHLTPPGAHRADLTSFGGALRASSWVYRPRDAEELRAAMSAARAAGRTVAFRGAGQSYGDASLNAGEVVIDCTAMNRILAWDPEAGLARCEPGVTIAQLWQAAIGDGWWPKVVPGTSFVTVGGAVSMNIHGKNAFRAGTFGEHVVALDLLTPSGEQRTVTRQDDPELFAGVVGGFGMLGAITSATLQLHRVHSGQLDVEPITAGSLGEMTSILEERQLSADYLVGWVDGFARGRSAGRGLVHAARYLLEGDDPDPSAGLRVAVQQPPTRLFGVLPGSVAWRLARPLVNDPGMRLVNVARHELGRRRHGHRHREPHASYAFLLDQLPDWRRSYGPGGLIQYQSFLPAATAVDVYLELLERARRAGLTPYLGVLKRHRPSPFLVQYSVDGFSLALDFRVTRANRSRLWALAAELDRVVVAGGGRFYFAKDATLTADRFAPFRAEPSFQRFLALKRRLDPEGLIASDLFRRVVGSAAPAS